jgi:hypothetical protein
MRYRSLRKGNLTRCCIRKVFRINGSWYRALEEAPEWKIIQHFVNWRRRGNARHGGNKFYDIKFRSPTYREIIKVVSAFLKACEGDVELALLAIDVSFDDKQHEWRYHDTFYSLMAARWLPDILAKAKIRRERVSTERRLEEIFAPEADNSLMLGVPALG